MPLWRQKHWAFLKQRAFFRRMHITQHKMNSKKDFLACLLCSFVIHNVCQGRSPFSGATIFFSIKVFTKNWKHFYILCDSLGCSVWNESFWYTTLREWGHFSWLIINCTCYKKRGTNIDKNDTQVTQIYLTLLIWRFTRVLPKKKGHLSTPFWCSY